MRWGVDTTLPQRQWGPDQESVSTWLRPDSRCYDGDDIHQPPGFCQRSRCPQVPHAGRDALGGLAVCRALRDVTGALCSLTRHGRGAGARGVQLPFFSSSTPETRIHQMRIDFSCRVSSFITLENIASDLNCFPRGTEGKGEALFENPCPDGLRPPKAGPTDTPGTGVGFSGPVWAQGVGGTSAFHAPCQVHPHPPL